MVTNIYVGNGTLWVFYCGRTLVLVTASRWEESTGPWPDTPLMAKTPCTGEQVNTHMVVHTIK